MTHWKNWQIFLLTWEHHVFPEFVKWLITYFQHTCRSPMESDFPYNKKQGLMSMPFPLGWCDHSTHSSHGPNVEKRPFTIHIGRFVFQDLSESVKLFWNWNSYQGPFLPSSSCMTGMPEQQGRQVPEKASLDHSSLQEDWQRHHWYLGALFPFLAAAGVI